MSASWSSSRSRRDHAANRAPRRARRARRLRGGSARGRPARRSRSDHVVQGAPRTARRDRRRGTPRTSNRGPNVPSRAVRAEIWFSHLTSAQQRRAHGAVDVLPMASSTQPPRTVRDACPDYLAVAEITSRPGTRSVTGVGRWPTRRVPIEGCFTARHDQAEEQRRRGNVSALQRAFARIDWELTDHGQLRPAGFGEVSATQGRPAVEDQLAGVRRSTDDPALLLGTAKEVLESTAKYVLDVFAIPYSGATDLEQL